MERKLAGRHIEREAGRRDVAAARCPQKGSMGMGALGAKE